MILNDINSVLDAAIRICVFVKMHEYPKVNSNEFVEFTNLLDQLETTLRKNKMVNNDTFRNQK